MASRRTCVCPRWSRWPPSCSPSRKAAARVRMRIRRILVALKDPAARSLPALGKAAQLARALDAELVLFQALTSALSFDTDTAALGGLKKIERGMREACLSRLERLAQRLRRVGIRV